MSKDRTPKKQTPMVAERAIWYPPMIFFFIASTAYAIVSDFEPIGTVTIFSLGCMFAFVIVYLTLVSRSIDYRPQDNPEGEIADAEGEFDDHFNPHSWWPLWAGVGVAVLATGLAVGWWLFGIGAVLSALAMFGYALENSRGPYAH